MSSGNPALIVSFSTRSNSWPISSNDRDLICWIDILGLARRFLGSFGALAAATLLWEQGGDPCAVDEVTSTAKGSE